MDNRYYVYIYLDPRKLGKYCYNDICFLFEPIYIGKGKDKRYKRLDNRNKYFKNKINKIKISELEPIIFKLHENLNEKQSFDLETKLIKEIGRLDLGTGPLVNMTDGGEGSSGCIVSEEIKNNTKKRMIGQNNPMFGKCVYGMLGKKHKEESKKLISKKVSGRNVSRESKKRLSNSKIGKSNPMYKNIIYFDINNKLPEKQIGEKNPSVKLSEKDVINIWCDILNKELTQTEIAKKFNVEKTTIYNIKTGRKWKYIYYNLKIIFLNKLVYILKNRVWETTNLVSPVLLTK
jgi:hypothetical protein